MIRIAVIDDHELIRHGLEYLLHRHEDLKVVLRGSSVEDLRGFDAGYDVLILDLYLAEDRPCLAAVKELAAVTRVLIVSASGRPADVLAAIRGGANGYVTKDAPSELIVAAMRTVAAGGFYLSAGLADILQSELDDATRPPAGTRTVRTPRTPRSVPVCRPGRRRPCPTSPRASPMPRWAAGWAMEALTRDGWIADASVRARVAEESQWLRAFLRGDDGDPAEDVVAALEEVVRQAVGSGPRGGRQRRRRDRSRRGDAGVGAHPAPVRRMRSRQRTTGRMTDPGPPPGPQSCRRTRTLPGGGGMRSHRTAAVLAVAALALFPFTGAAADDGPANGRAAARSCSGTACDGKDPALTGCNAGSYTVASRRVQAFDGYLELRYGPGRGRTCQVNWARFTKQGQGRHYNVWVERTPVGRSAGYDDKSLTQYSGGDEGTGVIYSDQVYAPSVPARACVEPARVRRAAGTGSQVCTDAV
ncbi:response regulator [Nonomuraea sp. NPDC052265]|uniref:response regulator n=1 Tax=Nonomuraea sp. NPDC052265 TaxID=3364374 RepID=UPI0037CAE186